MKKDSWRVSSGAPSQVSIFTERRLSPGRVRCWWRRGESSHWVRRQQEIKTRWWAMTSLRPLETHLYTCTIFRSSIICFPCWFNISGRATDSRFRYKPAHSGYLDAQTFRTFLPSIGRRGDDKMSNKFWVNGSVWRLPRETKGALEKIMRVMS